MAKVHPTLAFVFPGQGSQSMGMLKEASEKFPLITEIFKQAKQTLGKDL
jgi:[acyl-carrier-protein] S-malonyltransferase